MGKLVMYSHIHDEIRSAVGGERIWVLPNKAIFKYKALYPGGLCLKRLDPLTFTPCTKIYSIAENIQANTWLSQKFIQERRGVIYDIDMVIGEYAFDIVSLYTFTAEAVGVKPTANHLYDIFSLTPIYILNIDYFRRKYVILSEQGYRDALKFARNYLIERDAKRSEIKQYAGVGREGKFAEYRRRLWQYFSQLPILDADTVKIYIEEVIRPATWNPTPRIWQINPRNVAGSGRLVYRRAGAHRYEEA